ncbi:unnamed protein product [Lactuca saligna]|uniref:Transposase MuDR plant domain-containing protein n=1 Tax=Lactuca saligna TaxID=75948 RepID=A0AA36E1X7_LACSI|nr:unnamed protein product [Lactuca saligna]
MEEIDVEKHYAGHQTIFSIRLFYGREFTKFPGRRYVKGKERYVDLLDIDEFCVHDIDEMMETLGCVEEGIFDEFDEILNEEHGGITHESGNRDDVDDNGDSDDSKFLVDLDNLLDEPDIDMKEFLLNIDEYIEWVGDLGGSNVKETETREIDDIEVVNNEVFLYESSSDEGGSNRRRKSIKAIRRAMENSEARVSDPFYVYQKFTSSEELKDAIRQHIVETRRELDFIKNDKNRVRAICKGTIPDLGQLDPCGPSQSNKESEENKCS